MISVNEYPSAEYTLPHHGNFQPSYQLWLNWMSNRNTRKPHSFLAVPTIPARWGVSPLSTKKQ